MHSCPVLDHLDTEAVRHPDGHGATEHCSHASGELARRERLHHVVVRTELQPEDAILFVAARRQA